jgi:hypothetical protein
MLGLLHLRSSLLFAQLNLCGSLLLSTSSCSGLLGPHVGLTLLFLAAMSFSLFRIRAFCIILGVVSVWSRRVLRIDVGSCRFMRFLESFSGDFFLSSACCFIFITSLSGLRVSSCPSPWIFCLSLLPLLIFNSSRTCRLTQRSLLTPLLASIGLLGNYPFFEFMSIPTPGFLDTWILEIVLCTLCRISEYLICFINL